MKKLFVMFGVVCLLVVGFLFLPGRTTVHAPDTAPDVSDDVVFDDMQEDVLTDDITEDSLLVMKTVDEKNEQSHILASYPDVRSHPGMIGFVDRIEQRIEDFKQLALRTYLDLGDTHAGFPYLLTVGTDEIRSPQYQSIVVTVYEYTGGAHGTTDVLTVVYDMNGAQVSLEDLIEGDVYAVLSSRVRDVLPELLGDSYSEDLALSGTEPVVFNFSKYYVNQAGNVVVVFPPYQVAPGVVGTVEVEV